MEIIEEENLAENAMTMGKYLLGALNELMKTEGLPGFNHNIRSFEIVTRFERRYPEFDGLNLSSEVLVGILKHKTTYDKPGVTDHYSKVGPTFEAQVVDVADSLAYLSHDIDDGLTSGKVIFGRRRIKKFNRPSKRMIKKCLNIRSLRRSLICRSWICSISLMIV